MKNSINSKLTFNKANSNFEKINYLNDQLRSLENKIKYHLNNKPLVKL